MHLDQYFQCVARSSEQARSKPLRRAVARAQCPRHNSTVQPIGYVTRVSREAATKIAGNELRASAATSYGRRRSGRSAWDDGLLAAIFAACDAVTAEDAKLLFAIAKGRPLPAVSDWLRDAIDEEME